MKFLVVDDIFANRLLISEILTEFGHQIFEAENGKIALEILEKEDVDVVLMDIEMPVMNGLETTKFIRNEFPFPKKKTIIVALTAHNPSLFFEDYSDVGFDNLLTKPYSIDKFKQLVSMYEANSEKG